MDLFIFLEFFFMFLSFANQKKGLCALEERLTSEENDLRIFIYVYK